MPLARDLSDLPSPGRTGGWPPDSSVRFTDALAGRWRRQAEAEGKRPRAVPGSRFRHSDAGGCSRAIAYAALDVPESNPIDLAGHWTMGLGTLLHDLLQEELAERYGHESEVVVIIDGFEGSGHADGAVVDTGRRIVTEYKTVGGFAYKLAVGERGDPQGPSYSYVLQVALNGLGLDADEVVVGLLSREAISIQAAKRKGINEVQRFAAEWTLKREQYEPLARAEIERVSAILALVDGGLLPARKIPDPELPKRHVISDPLKGTWVETDDDGMVLDAGSTWRCSYCRWMTTCSKTEAYRTPVDSLIQLGVLRRVPTKEDIHGEPDEAGGADPRSEAEGSTGGP